MLKAFPRILNYYSKIKLFIAGMDEGELDNLIELSKALNIQDNVEFSVIIQDDVGFSMILQGNVEFSMIIQENVEFSMIVQDNVRIINDYSG